MATPIQIQNVVVVGKSDHSTAILEALSQHNHHSHHAHGIHLPTYKLTIITRPHQAAPPLPSVEQYECTFRQDDLTTAFQHARAHVVISATAPADVHFQKELIDAALAAHVQHFIPFEFNYDTEDPAVRKAYPPAEARAEVLSYLEKSKIGWTAISTGCLLANNLNLLGFDLLWRSATIYGTGYEKWPCSTLPWVGKAVLEVLENIRSSKAEGREHYLYKAELVTCQNEILAAAKKIGGQEWEVTRADVGECTIEAERRMEMGFLDGAMMLRERALLFGEIGDIDVWCQRIRKNESREEGVEKIVRMVMEGSRDAGSDCGCG